jgi:hypothetical protein
MIPSLSTIAVASASDSMISGAPVGFAPFPWREKALACRRQKRAHYTPLPAPRQFLFSGSAIF